jgi:hypothetical protein
MNIQEKMLNFLEANSVEELLEAKDEMLAALNDIAKITKSGRTAVSKLEKQVAKNPLADANYNIGKQLDSIDLSFSNAQMYCEELKTEYKKLVDEKRKADDKIIKNINNLKVVDNTATNNTIKSNLKNAIKKGATISDVNNTSVTFEDEKSLAIGKKELSSGFKYQSSKGNTIKF